MQYFDDVTSSIRQPDEESSETTVFIRWDFYQQEEPATEKEPARMMWHYKEYQMTHNEYGEVQVGKFEAYTDKLRSIERGYLYDIADKRIMKYSTDVPDDAKRQQWVDYKRAVRATPLQSAYPEQVEYPARPE